MGKNVSDRSLILLRHELTYLDLASLRVLPIPSLSPQDHGTCCATLALVGWLSTGIYIIHGRRPIYLYHQEPELCEQAL